MIFWAKSRGRGVATSVFLPPSEGRKCSHFTRSLNLQCIQNFVGYICIYNQVKTDFSVGELDNFVTRNLKYCLRLGLHHSG